MANPILKEKMLRGESVFVAGCWDEISAMIFEKTGFGAVKLGSHNYATALGLPDLGLISPRQIREKIFDITDRIEIPLTVDFESGFGDVIKAVFWARQFERAGATAIHIDDYGETDKCPWVPPYLPSLDKAETLVDKIKAICDARRSEDFLVIARSGAPFSSSYTDEEAGLEEGIRRSILYKEAGADIIWGRAYSVEGLKRFRQAIDGPMCTQMGAKKERKNSAAHGKYTAPELFDLGYQLVFTGTSLIPAALKAMLESGTVFSDTGDVNALSDMSLPFEEWVELVGLSKYLEMRKK